MNFLQRGPLRIFYTIYQFDPTAAEQESVLATKNTNIKPETKIGSTFEISETVTVTEIVKKEEATPTCEEKPEDTMEQTDGNVLATATTNCDSTVKSVDTLQKDNMEHQMSLSEDLTAQNDTQVSGQKPDEPNSTVDDNSRGSVDNLQDKKDPSDITEQQNTAAAADAEEPMDVTEDTAVQGSTAQLCAGETGTTTQAISAESDLHDTAARNASAAEQIQQNTVTDHP